MSQAPKLPVERYSHQDIVDLRHRAIEIVREVYDVNEGIEVKPSSRALIPGSEDSFANAFRVALEVAKEELVAARERPAPVEPLLRPETLEMEASLKSALRQAALKRMNETFGTSFVAGDLRPGIPFDTKEPDGPSVLEMYRQALEEEKLALRGRAKEPQRGASAVLAEAALKEQGRNDVLLTHAARAAESKGSGFDLVNA